MQIECPAGVDFEKWKQSILQDRVGDSGFYESVKHEFGERQVRQSCIADPSTEQIFRSFLKDKNIKTAVEIGTFYGTGTAVLAHYADRVVTMDINIFNNEAVVLWVGYGVVSKIDYHILTTRDTKTAKQKVLDTIDSFDFAFIDGNHRTGVYDDWELLQHCGRVLFHDYYHSIEGIPGLRPEWGAKESPWIVGLVDSLPSKEVTIREPFAYWENGNNAS